MRKAIGIDLGGSPVAGILADIEGNIMERRSVEIPVNIPFEEAARYITKLIKKLYHQDVSGIGIGTPGHLDSARGICLFSPNYPNWKGADITSVFKQEFGKPVFILNDVNSAALGEKYYGAASTCLKNQAGPILLDDLSQTSSVLFRESGTIKRDAVKSMFFLTIGVGIGGALVIGNELFIGANEGAGEIGHVTLIVNGPLCSCGNNGCFEALSSINAVRQGYSESLNRGWNSSILQHADSIGEITFGHMKKTAASGDELTLKIISIIGKYIGMGMAVIVNMFDPELIVIGGEVVEIIDNLHPFMIKELKNRVKMVPYNKIKYVSAKLNELSGAYGAAAFVFKRMFGL